MLEVELTGLVPFHHGTNRCIQVGSGGISDDPSVSVLRLYLHEDGSVKPASRDADLQPSRRDHRQKQPPVLHDPDRRSEEEHDHRSHCQVTGEFTGV